MEYTKSLTYDQTVLLQKFVHYSKKIASFFISLQKNKRQLCQFLKSIDLYILPFRQLDLDKHGVISQKNLQLFLIRHKYYFKPQQINRYFQKYVHGKESLEYNDILETLLPHSDYILMSTILKKNPKFCLQSSHICHQSQNKVIANILSLIISQEIEFLNQDYSMMNNITDSSLQIGAILWRSLDRQHNNELNYGKFKLICEEFNSQFQKYQWDAFINWHFRTHKKKIRRADFLQLCNVHNENKRNRSACNYEHFIKKQQQKKNCLQEKVRQDNAQDYIKQKIGMVRQMKSNSCYQIQKIVSRQQFPNRTLNRKILLTGKLGYKIPKNCIKFVE